MMIPISTPNHTTFEQFHIFVLPMVTCTIPPPFNQRINTPISNGPLPVKGGMRIGPKLGGGEQVEQRVVCVFRELRALEVDGPS
jgi:putative hemolysin